jgi:sporulation protein YlmC with PRC-barrel domain
MWGRSDITIPISQVQGVGDRIVLKSSKVQLFEIAKSKAVKPQTPQGSDEVVKH